MQKVPLELAQAGMVLAKPVVNEKGMPLCAEGTELTDSLLERLKRMQVTSLTLMGHPLDLGVEEKGLTERIAELEDRFARVAGDPRMERLQEAIAQALRAEYAEPQAADNDTPEASHDE